jgi:hypothetical protein
VSSDWFREAVSVPAVFVVNSSTAWVSEYGEEVRVAGMTSIGLIVPSPLDSNVNTRSPRRVPVRTCAVVSEPSETVPSIVNITTALRPCSDTFETLPTLMPEMITSLPAARPPASSNSAWYRIELAHDDNFSGESPTRMTRMTRTTPMNPVRTSCIPRYLNIRAPNTSRPLA